MFAVVTAYPFACAADAGRSTAIRTGAYSVQVRLLDGANQPLSETSTMSYRVSDQAPAQADLTFEVR